MPTTKPPSRFVRVFYILVFVILLVITTILAGKGARVIEFWSKGSNFIFLDPAMYNGVVIDSAECPIFMDENGSTLTFKIRNKDFLPQTAGVMLLLSNRDADYEQVIFTEETKLAPGEEAAFSWPIDQTNMVGGKILARMFVGISLNHPMNSVRACVIVPWSGPLPVGILNDWLYPTLLVFFFVSLILFLLTSDLRAWKRSRLFFFIFANICLIGMVLLFLLKLYMPAMLILPFLAIGVIALLQISPYLSESDYKKYLKSD